MKLNVFLLFGFSLILSHAASAQDATAAPADAPIEKSVVQTETVIEDRSFSSTSKIILDEAAIQKSRAPNITTLLSTQANIAVSTSNLQPGSIYLRGGDSGHILILVDGLPFYDASTVQRTMNLNEIDIKSIRRIEIIKGSQSVWYGGQALTGVIKIETFPKEIEKHQSATIEAGMRNYKKASAYGLQPLGDHDAVLARAQGSEKDNRSPMLGSEETYRGKLWSGEVGYLHQGDSDFFAKLGQLNDRNQITNTQFTPPGFTNYTAIDAKNFVSEVDIKNLMLGWSGKSYELRPKLLASYQVAERSFIEREPVLASDDKYGSALVGVRYEMALVERENWHWFLGLSYSKEDFLNRSYGVEKINAFNEQKGIFMKGNVDLTPGILFEAGIRTDYYKKADHAESYQAGISFFEMLKLEYSTGFKAPSLFQTSSPTYGNPDLKPEKAQTYTVSFEEKIGDQQALSISLFETHFSDLITSQSVGGKNQYYNVSRAITRGGEAQYTYQTLSKIRADVAVGYQEPWDVENAQWLLRRPLKTASLRVAKTWLKADLGAEVIMIGERLDRFSQTFPPLTPSSTYGSLDAYTVTNLFASYEFQDQMSVYTRGSNVFGQRYEESRGYHNEGAFWLVGLEFRN